MNGGVIVAEATLQLQLDCVDSTFPAPPFIEKLYSTTTTSIDVEWENAVDRNTPANLISYKLYWSTDRTTVENKTALSQDLSAGTLVSNLTGLTADTEYFIAIEATDNTGQSSGLSEIHALKTIATENVLTGTPYFVLDPANATINGNTWTVPETEFNSTPQIGNVLVSVTDTDYYLVKIVTSALNTGIYTFTVADGSLGDVFESLTISSDLGFNESPQTVSMRPSLGAKSFISKSSVSICRNDTTADDVNLSTKSQLTTEHLSQINITPYRRFQPSLINELVFSGGLSNPRLTGSIGFRGEGQLGVEVGFQITDKLEGVYSCELTGMPLTKGFTIPVAGFPVQADFSLDVELKLALSAEAGMQAGAKAEAYLSFDNKLIHNPITNQWEPSENADIGYRTETSYDDGAEVAVRASLIPSLSASFYKGLGPEISLSVDNGVTTEVSADLVPITDPVYKTYGYPLKLDKFKVYADTALIFDADLKLFGQSFYKLPSWEFYRSDPLTLFDTPLICTNSGATRDDCKTEKGIQNQNLAQGDGYPLQIQVVDGTLVKSLKAEKNLNKMDLGSLDWQVFPKNGYIEEDKKDPRKATFHAYDDGNYTIVASGYGELGSVARKFASFHFTSDNKCEYGLGQPLPPDSLDYAEYLLGGMLDFINGIPETPWMGFLIPDDAQLGDPDKYYREVCTFPPESNVWGRSVTATYYGGERDGKFVLETNEPGEFSSFVEYYQNGYLVKRRSNYSHDQKYEDEIFDVLPIPGSRYNFSPVTGFTLSYVDENGLIVRQDGKADVLNDVYVKTVYYPRAENAAEIKRSVTVYPLLTINFDDKLSAIDMTWAEYYELQRPYANDAFSGEEVFPNAGNGIYYHRDLPSPIQSWSYYPDGHLEGYSNYVTGESKTCNLQNLQAYTCY